MILAIVDGAGNDVAGREHDTSAYAHTDFAPPSASFASFADHGVDANVDGLFEVLSVDAAITVHEAGEYVVEGSLLDGNGTFIGSASSAPQLLAAGLHTLSLPFDGAAIRESSTDGPYAVAGLELKRAGTAVDAIAGTRATGAYLRTAFQGAGAAATGTVTDRTEDTDADTLHDWLAVDVDSPSARPTSTPTTRGSWTPPATRSCGRPGRPTSTRACARSRCASTGAGSRATALTVRSASRTCPSTPARARSPGRLRTTAAYAASAFEPAGVVRGRVLLGGAPVAGTDVFIGGVDGDVTDAAGRSRLIAVDGGTQIVRLDTTEPGPSQYIVDGEIVGTGTSTSLALPLGDVRNLTFSAGDADPPAPPVLTGSDPDSPANDTTPRIQGAAETDSIVKLYASSDCTGPVAAQGAAASLASTGLGVAVVDDSTTTFHATATDESVNTSPCSASSVTFVEDSTAPPAPEVTGSDPASPANDNAPRITGSAESGASVRLHAGTACGGPVAGEGTAGAFASPGLAVAVADDTTTTFHASATDAAGNVSPCSTSAVSYVEDSTAPTVSIDSGPTGSTDDTTPTFAFSTNDAGAALACRVDDVAFAPCASP